MCVRILPNLLVSNGPEAVRFYRSAFNADVLVSYGTDEEFIIAALSVGGAQFLVASESPSLGTPAPSRIGATTVRIDLLTDDPDALHRQAIEAGGIEIEPVVDHPIGPRMGVIQDPFGHHRWLIGASWDPA